MSLFRRVTDIGNLYQAWKYVRRKGRRLGVDGASIVAFGNRVTRRLETLRRDLLNGEFLPEPNRRVFIDKPGKPDEKRELRIPRVRDRIVQQAVRQVIEPVLEKRFLNVSYAYRPGKGCHAALRRLLHEIRRRGSQYAITSDIDNFFNTIDHDILMARFREIFPEPRLAELVALFLKNGLVTWKGRYIEVVEGVPTGSVLSPVLANLYLHPLDEFVTSRQIGYVRYADDFVALHDDKEALAAFQNDIRLFLNDTLKLRLNDETPIVYSLKGGVPFLGFTVQARRLLVQTKKFAAMKNALNMLEKTSRHKSVRAVLVKVAETAGGWKNYYSLTSHDHDKFTIDSIVAKFLGAFLHARIKKGEIRAAGDVKELLLDIPRLTLDGDAFIGRIESKIASIQRFEARRREEKPGKRPAGPGGHPGAGKRPEGMQEEKKPGDPGDASRKAERKLARQRRIYEKKYAEISELIIMSAGVSLGCSGNRVTWRVRGKHQKEVSINKLKHIFVGVDRFSISGSLVKLCASRKVPITFADRSGKTFAVMHIPDRTNVELLLDQIKTFRSPAGLEIAQGIVRGKINNQINLLKYFSKYLARTDAQRERRMDEAVDAMERILDTVMEWRMQPGGFEKNAQALRGFESTAAAHYWKGVRAIVMDDIEFPRRVRQGARDPFNMALNYGYGILYGRLYTLCTVAGLNPSIGILHHPFRGKPVLTYDLIEEYRAFIVDRTVIGMVTKHEPLKTQNGLLAKYTRSRLASKIIQRLRTSAKYRKKRLPVETIMKEQITRLKLHIAGKKPYKPFIARW